MVSQTVGMAPMSLRHVLHVTAQLDASSARTGTAPIRFSCVMATMIALMDLMKMLHSAVCNTYILVYPKHGYFRISPFHTLKPVTTQMCCSHKQRCGIFLRYNSHISITLPANSVRSVIGNILKALHHFLYPPDFALKNMRHIVFKRSCFKHDL